MPKRTKGEHIDPQYYQKLSEALLYSIEILFRDWAVGNEQPLAVIITKEQAAQLMEIYFIERENGR